MADPGTKKRPDDMSPADTARPRRAFGQDGARRAGHIALLAVLFLLSPGRPLAADTSEPVLVFAAASLADALTDAAQRFEVESGYAVTMSFAGSGVLARQIMLGAPADLFLSADPIWADALEQAALVETGRRRDLLGNRLVLVGTGPDGPPPQPLESLDLDAILGDGRLALGLVEAVPAGRYGRAALQSAGLWDTVKDRLAQTDNVRAALALVAAGAAPAGLVYATDARADPRVHTLAVIAPDTHPAIVYPLVDLARSDHPAENAFYDFLGSDRAATIFASHGFAVLPSRNTP